MNLPVPEVVDEVATFLTRLEKLFSVVQKERKRTGSTSCEFGCYVVLERRNGQTIRKGVLGKSRKQDAVQTLRAAQDIGTWLYQNIHYVTSGQGNYMEGAVRLDRYILAVALEPSYHALAEALVVAAVEHETNLQHKDRVEAIHARHNICMNSVLDLALYL